MITEIKGSDRTLEANMKVYVVTKAEPLCEEIYVTVKATAKEAEKVIREKFPNARKDQKPGLTSYTCKDRSGHISLMFIRDENI